MEDGEGGDGVVLLPVLMAEQGLAPSRSAARRLLAQGAVSLDGQRVREERLPLAAARLSQGVMLKVGKRRYLKLQRS